MEKHTVIAVILTAVCTVLNLYFYYVEKKANTALTNYLMFRPSHLPESDREKKMLKRRIRNYNVLGWILFVVFVILALWTLLSSVQ